jgi:hypothetical protein
MLFKKKYIGTTFKKFNIASLKRGILDLDVTFFHFRNAKRSYVLDPVQTSLFWLEDLDLSPVR